MYLETQTLRDHRLPPRTLPRTQLFRGGRGVFKFTYAKLSLVIEELVFTDYSCKKNALYLLINGRVQYQLYY